MQAKKAANATMPSPIRSQWRCSSTGRSISGHQALRAGRRFRRLRLAMCLQFDGIPPHPPYHGVA